MNLPKKKYIKEGFADNGKTMEFLDGQYVLDSSAQKQLADYMEQKGFCLGDRRNVIKFLRGE